jgi:hypothetical protein
MQERQLPAAAGAQEHLRYDHVFRQRNGDWIDAARPDQDGRAQEQQNQAQ